MQDPTDIPAFADRLDDYVERANRCLDAALPPADESPARLHEAMRYAVLSGGKRIRPLLAYATCEALGIDPARVDGAATAIELIHAFSLVHDDLPAMDDDDLRRGQPTVHRRYDEATAILAADALQPLAFATIIRTPGIAPAQAVELVHLVADACGSRGMTGGQAIDLSSEGKTLTRDELEAMHRRKTGALIHAAVMSGTLVATGISAERHRALDRYGRDIGLAFQIRDDLLDVEGETGIIGKPAGSDLKSAKATWPALFGEEEAHARLTELLRRGLSALEVFGGDAEPLDWIARYIVERQN